ncbi:MAG: hypothetical protein LRY27_03140 [Chitinophagales bacterium]|nr:hypothetical protein [Chitinophagales bacterium]
MQAITLLKSEINTENDPALKTAKLNKLALAYTYSNQAQGAVDTYKELYKQDNNPNYLLDLAKALMKNEQFDSAKIYLEKYQTITYDQYTATPLLIYCGEVLNFEPKNSNLKITNLENINTPDGEYAPRLYTNNQLVFTSTRGASTGTYVQPWDNQKYPDLFTAQKTGNKWGQVAPFDQNINTEMAEGIAAFSKDYKTMYYTRCNYTENGNGYCKIYEASYNGNAWGDTQKVEIFSDTVNVGQPFISADGKRLFFSSDAPMGYGGNDIYFMLKQENGWSQPYNAGFSVNTDKEELFPTTDANNNLYFSSNGKNGYGGLDIFKAAPDKMAYGTATIMPYPINSGADDFSILFLPNNNDGIVLESAVFSSSRKEGKGNDDIYLYEKIKFNLYQLDLLVLETIMKTPMMPIVK